MLIRTSLRTGQDATPLDFISQHPVFRLEELEEAYREMGRTPRSARESVAYHVKAGRLWSVRRGVYAHTVAVDPWLLASKLVDDAVVSHDGVLSFHGLTGLGHQLSFMTTQRTSVARFNDVIYQPLRVEDRRRGADVHEVEREGQPVRVKGLCVTLVDCLTELNRAPPPVQLMEVFKKTAPATDPGEMIHYAVSLKNSLLVSRLAFFLSCSRPELPTAELQRLNRHCLQAPAYFLRSARTKNDSIIARWNLIVPQSLRRFWPR